MGRGKKVDGPVVGTPSAGRERVDAGPMRGADESFSQRLQVLIQGVFVGDAAVGVRQRDRVEHEGNLLQGGGLGRGRRDDGIGDGLLLRRVPA